MELRLACHSGTTSPALAIEAVYDAMPLHASVKPRHRTCSRESFAATLTALPAPSMTATWPSRGPMQHSLAGADVTVRCSPAQFVARTARW